MPWDLPYRKEATNNLELELNSEQAAVIAILKQDIVELSRCRIVPDERRRLPLSATCQTKQYRNSKRTT